MRCAHVTPQQLRALPARRPSLLWLLVFVVLLKAAVPLLAASSARERGLSLADVCSVYGVRTTGTEQTPDTTKRVQVEHASSEHCVLTPLLAGAVLATPTVAAVLLHARTHRRAQPPAELPSTPDASFAWLASRTHAPPLPV